MALKTFLWEVFPEANLIRQEAQTKAFQKEQIRCYWKNPKTTIFKNTLILFPSLKLGGTSEKCLRFRPTWWFLLFSWSSQRPFVLYWLKIARNQVVLVLHRSLHQSIFDSIADHYLEIFWLILPNSESEATQNNVMMRQSDVSTCKKIVVHI